MSSSFIYPNYIIGVCGERGPTGATGSTGPIGPTGNSGLNIFGTTGPGATGWSGYYGQGNYWEYTTIPRSVQGVTVAVGNHIGLRFVTHFTDGTTAISSGSPFIGFTGFWFVQAGATCPGCTFSPVVSTNNFAYYKFSDSLDYNSLSLDYNSLSTKYSTITLKTINTRTPETIGITLTDDLKNIRIKYTDYDGITLFGATAQALVIGNGVTAVAGATGSRWYGDENVVDWVTRQALEGITSISGITTDESDAFYPIDTKNNSIFQIKKSELNSIKINIKPDNTIRPDESKSLLLIVPLETAFTGAFEISGQDPVQVYFPLNVIPKPEPGINVYAAISYGQDWYMNCVGLGITQDYWSKQKLNLDKLYLPSENLLTLLLASWGTPSYDLNNDGTVNATDVTIALGSWGANIFQYYYKNCVNITGISYGRECIGPVPPPPQPPPTLASVQPATGPESGGTDIIITGTGFTGANSVKVGSNEATNLQVIDPTTIQAKTPSGSGPRQITVTTPGGSVTGLSFVYAGPPPALPAINNVTPQDGHRYGNDEIVIYGTNLDTTIQVIIQDQEAQIIQKDAASVKVSTRGGNAGPATIRLTNASGSTEYTGWSYSPAVPPIITSIDPNTGPASGVYTIIITGSNFDQVESVRIGNNECLDQDISSQRIKATVPGGQKTQLLTVQTYEGSDSIEFTYQGNPPPSPVIDEVVPGYGPIEGGTEVELRGENLDYQGDLTVTIGGNIASVENRTNTLVTIITPPSSTEAAQQELRFTALNGTVTETFTYTQTSPIIQNITSQVNGSDPVQYLKTTPSAPNQTVCIYGQNFMGQYPVDKINISSAHPAGVDGSYSLFSIDKTVTPVSDTQIEFQLEGVPFEHNHRVKITAIKSNNISSNELPTNWQVDGVISSIKLDSDTNLTAPYGISIGETPVIRVYGTYMDYQTNQSGFYYSGVQNTFGITCIDQSGFEPNANYFKIKLPAITTKGTYKFWRRRKRDILGESTSTLELQNQFIYYHPAPQITTIQPNAGLRTDQHPVRIIGSRLYYPGEFTKVFVNNVQVSVTDPTENELHITVPPSQTSGWVPITVQRSGGPWPQNGGIQETTVDQGFQYTEVPVPTIISVTPNNGPTTGGTSITINGTNFVNVSSVRVGGTSVTHTVNSAGTQITATTPPGIAGSQQIEVTTQTGSASIPFTYTVPAPTITSVTPNNGPTTGGTSITINGTNFVNVSSVTVGGVLVTTTSTSPTQITATTPPGTAGVQQIVVTTQTGSANVQFTYTVPQPTITSVTPDSGWGKPDYGGQSNPPATSVTITGSNLDNCTVKIGEKNCEITDQSPISITIDVPVQTDGFEGHQQLTVNRTGATSATETFTYTLPPPRLKLINQYAHDISPTSCVYTGGCLVTAKGWYLKNTSNQSRVVFSTQPQIEVQCNSDSTKNELKFISPLVSVSDIGLCDLTFIRYDNQGDDSEESFTFTSSQTALVITSISPTSGPMTGLNEVTISGQNFTQNGGVNQVLIGGAACDDVFVVDSTTVTATVPASTSSGPRAVEVKNAYQQSAVLSDAYTYTTPCPQPNSITPESGPACSSAGVNFTITGLNLQGINQIIFNNDSDLSATNINITTNGTNLTARTPTQFPLLLWNQQLPVKVIKPGCPDITLTARYTPRSANYTITNAFWLNTICVGSGNFGPLYINGNNFTNQGINKVSLQRIGSEIIATSFTIGPNLITAQFNTPVQSGSWKVSVETPCYSEYYPLSDILNCEPVCSGILDHVVPATNQGTVINLVTSNVVNGNTVLGWDVNLYGTSTNNVSLLAATGTGFMRNPNAGTNTVRTNLALGTTVDASAFFYGNSSIVIGTSPGQWTANSIGYFGLKFINEETNATHYGYVAMRIGTNATIREIIGYCYNPIPNGSITVQEIV